MKRTLLLVMAAMAILLSGCMSTTQEDIEAYNYLRANIDDPQAVDSFIITELSGGSDIDRVIAGGDTVLMIAARFSTNVEVLKVITSYFPDISKVNWKTDMSALEYLALRENTQEMERFLIEQSVKQELLKKANEAKDAVVETIFNRF